ncbi:MAG: hypothetical protein M3R02_26990 [Chloroflexota bacterium]|nr:hypothetical protein [Chloroflexota bacterium]
MNTVEDFYAGDAFVAAARQAAEKLLNRPLLWHGCLPWALASGDFSVCDEHKVVLPSWNASPLREVVRYGKVVAVIAISGSDVFTLLRKKELLTEAAARVCFAEMHAEEGAAAREIFDDLPDEMKEGGAVDPVCEVDDLYPE